MEDNQKVNKIDEPGILYPQVLKTKEIQGWDFHQNQSNPGEISKASLDHVDTTRQLSETKYYLGEHF